uniref:Putative secreted protein n=1 Tax=Ixodes scapularis TaxID=6945 RepID=A0A4D5RY57_IXOSC
MPHWSLISVPRWECFCINIRTLLFLVSALTGHVSRVHAKLAEHCEKNRHSLMTYINFSSRYKHLPNAAAKKICLLLLSESYFIWQTFHVCCLSYKVFLLYMFNKGTYILSLF